MNPSVSNGNEQIPNQIFKPNQQYLAHRHFYHLPKSISDLGLRASFPQISTKHS